MLASFTDGILIGVIDVASELVSLLEAAVITDVTGGRFSGHLDLVRANRFAVNVLGFSIAVVGRQIHSVYRTSALNANCADFVVPDDMIS